MPSTERQFSTERQLSPAYRPALALVTGIAAAGALVALSGLRSRRAVAPDA
jgi:hypothetical protein